MLKLSAPLCLALLGVPGALNAQTFKPYVTVRKPGTSQDIHDRVKNFRLRGKRGRPNLGLPAHNATVHGSTPYWSPKVMMLGSAERKRPTTTAIVHSSDAIAIPVHTTNLDYQVQGGRVYGITDRLARKSTGRHSRLRLLLVARDPGADNVQISVKEGRHRTRRYNVRVNSEIDWSAPTDW